jgi:exodeoxyribonuclease V beta subunit
MRLFDALSVPLDGRMLIEASAGTGKTHAITTLLLRLLLERELGIDQILVVTFTEAATAELRRRVRDRIARALAMAERRAAADADPELAAIVSRAPLANDARRRLRRALQRVDEAPISTIHGFCQRALHECAFDTGVRFDAELTGDLSALRDDVIHDAFVRLLRDTDGDTLAALQRCGVTPSSCRTLVDQVTRSPDLLLQPDVVATAGDPPGFARAWQELSARWDADRICQLIDGAALGRSYQRRWLAGWCQAIADALAMPPSLSQLPEKLERFTSTAIAATGASGRRIADHAAFVAAEALLAEASSLDRWQRGRVVAFKRELIAEAQREIPRRRRQLGLIGFDDLLLTLASSLASPSGELVAAQVRRRHPVALVDEFQDTDPLQWSILDRIWQRGTLLLIGDPKQAIYSFRGADVYAYLAAARTVQEGRCFTMGVNWRSDPSLIRAVHTIFRSARQPMLIEEIGYPEVSARPAAEDRFRGDDAVGIAPLRILFAPRTSNRRLSKGDLESSAGEAVAREIETLLARGTLDGKPVRPNDIAVLTRTNAQAFDMQRALRRRRVAAVVQGDQSVLASDDAEEMARILRAIADPSDGRVRAALITRACGLVADDLATMTGAAGHPHTGEPCRWEAWVQLFRDLSSTWTARGLIAMFRAFSQAVELPSRLLALPDGERRMTNLNHLLELLYGAETSMHLGPRAVCAWLYAKRTMDETRAEDAQIRLESDEHAVRLTTVHKSKGLEYEVVYAPFTWDAKLLKPRGEKLQGQTGKGIGEIFFHEEHQRQERLVLWLLAGCERDAELRRLPSYQRAERELLAEQLRLFYVALTRAKRRATLVWGAASDFDTAALAYLIHAPSPPAPLSEGVGSRGNEVEQVRTKVADLSDHDLRADLSQLVERAGAAIEVVTLDASPSEPSPIASRALPALDCRKIERRIERWWRTASFSQLVAASKTAVLDPVEGRDRDENATELDGGSPAKPLRPCLLAEFPRGAKAGNFFHEILEVVDFTTMAAACLEQIVATKLEAFRYDAHHAASVCSALRQICATPLDRRGLRLEHIAADKRVNELEFHLAVAGRTVEQRKQLALALDEGPSERQLVTRDKLAAVFRAHPSDALARDYHERVRQLQFLPLEGYLKGYVDLVFVDRGRWFVVDYKTNHLGDQLVDYAREHLPDAMSQGHYYLQYHLYTLALHRFLSRRLAGYEYGKHFGGVFYLFIKGMTPETGQDAGVFFEKPPRARIEALSRLLSTGSANDA